MTVKVSSRCSVRTLLRLTRKGELFIAPMGTGKSFELSRTGNARCWQGNSKVNA